MAAAAAETASTAGSAPATAPLRVVTLDPPYDSVVLFVAGLLMALGVTMVYSASATVSGAPFDWRHWWDTPLRQGAFAVAGFITMVVAAHVDYRIFAWSAPGRGWRAGLLWLLAVVLLMAVLVPGVGRTALGARRSLPVPGLGGLGFQPSEVAKIVLVIWTAAWLTRPLAPRPGEPEHARRTARGRDVPPGDIRRLRRGLLPLAASGGLLVALVGVEDFGTAALMGAVLFLLMLVGGARLLHLAALGFVAAAGAAVLVLSESYRVERVLSYWNRLMGRADAADASYQVNQALMAIGSGGWFGRGLGAGVQKYGYLPQDNNDFILAIICEELGAIGGLVVVLLFLVLLWRGARIAARAADAFGRLLALGLTLTICLQAAFNIGVVTNSVPTKGISLPFVSAGGSGVILLGAAAGLLAAVGRRERVTG